MGVTEQDVEELLVFAVKWARMKLKDAQCRPLDRYDGRASWKASIVNECKADLDEAERELAEWHKKMEERK